MKPLDRSELLGLMQMLANQREWSLEMFGPGPRTQGILAHIEKEMREVRDSPRDVTEWIDIVILALDGAWRTGAEPVEVVMALLSKYTVNFQREWPDWRTADPNEPIEHIRDKDETA